MIASALWIVLAVFASVWSGDASPVQDPAPAAAPRPAVPQVSPPSADPPAAEPPAAPAARRPDPGRPRPDGPMSPEMAERIIAVARDVSPELAQELAARQRSAPEEMSQSMRQNARRLMAMAVLKERNPELYAIRVEDLRLQLELRALGERWRVAREAKDDRTAASIMAQIEAKCRAQSDLDLKARAQELVALDAQLKSMRDELVREQARSVERVAERVEATTSGQPLPGRDRDRDRDPPRPRGREVPPAP
jgi:uncharacterized protein YerC